MVKPVSVAQSRAIPVSPHSALGLTLPIPLTELFTRRYGPLPPIRQVEGQDGPWGRPGQSRTIVTADGGTMREVLVEVDAPHSFGYRLSELTGPMRPLVETIDGRWEFAPQGTGTLVTWGWTLHPRKLGVPLMSPIAAMWRGYARQALEELSRLLLATDAGRHAAN